MMGDTGIGLYCLLALGVVYIIKWRMDPVGLFYWLSHHSPELTLYPSAEIHPRSLGLLIARAVVLDGSLRHVPGQGVSRPWDQEGTTCPCSAVHIEYSTNFVNACSTTGPRSKFPCWISGWLLCQGQTWSTSSGSALRTSCP